MSEPDQEIAHVPPNAFRVVRRAIVLASCVCRADVEPHSNDKKAQKLHDRMQRWVNEIGVRDEFESREWNSVVAPLGSLDPQTRVNLSWRTEGLLVLAWALGRADLSPYDEQADGPTLGDAICFLDDSVKQLLLSPKLRPVEDLEWIADLTLAVHWRLREYSIRPGPMDFRAFAPTVQWARFPVDDLNFMENDLALRGQPLFKVDSSTLHECTSIIRERQQAANWLLGDQELYSEVTCDT